MTTKIKQHCILTCLFFLSSMLLCSCSSSNSEKNVGIEKAKYIVIEEKGNCQIRQYEPYIAAETLVDSDFDNAGVMLQTEMDKSLKFVNLLWISMKGICYEEGTQTV